MVKGAASRDSDQMKARFSGIRVRAVLREKWDERKMPTRRNSALGRMHGRFRGSRKRGSAQWRAIEGQWAAFGPLSRTRFGSMGSARRAA